MGEMRKSIFIIGSPEVDIMLSDKLPGIDKVKKRYNIPFNKYGIFIYHPVTTEIANLTKNIRNIISALVESKKNFVVIYPNNDFGSEKILEELELIKNNENFKFFPSLRFEYYITLMKNADFIIGNSSGGVREASVFGLPSINLGSRQKDRSQHQSIYNVNEEKSQILDVMGKITGKLDPSLNFGKGDSSKLFMEALLKKELWNIPNQKQFKDLH